MEEEEETPPADVGVTWVLGSLLRAIAGREEAGTTPGPSVLALSLWQSTTLWGLLSRAAPLAGL